LVHIKRVVEVLEKRCLECLTDMGLQPASNEKLERS
jgi:hypothetical protein